MIVKFFSIFLCLFALESFAGDLIVAIKERNLEQVKKLLDEGVQTNVFDKDGTTPLIYALGNIDLVKLLLDDKYKTDVNFPNSNGNIPLHIAVLNYDSSFVKLLLEKGAKVNIKNGSNMTPLDFSDWAISLEGWNDDHQVIKKLLEEYQNN